MIENNEVQKWRKKCASAVDGEEGAKGGDRGYVSVRTNPAGAYLDWVLRPFAAFLVHCKWVNVFFQNYLCVGKSGKKGIIWPIFKKEVEINM